ncbi:MAG: arylamine N-acetyltransferase [Cyclobacteriaceae bacterium]
MNQQEHQEIRPKLPHLDVERYLERINVRQSYQPTLAFLKQLHRSHLFAIPFENLDIHHGRKIMLDVQRNFKKVVENKRGGFCYELNGLFYHLLLQLKFDCKLISARVFREDGSLGPEYDHMAIVVRMDGKQWLVDVGFGDSFIEPKLIEPYQSMLDYNRYFKFEQDPDENYILLMSKEGVYYERKYVFSLKTQEYIQFLDMCDYHQTDSDSPFRKKKMITIATKSGRITLTDQLLKTTHLGEETETKLLNQDEFYSKLEHHFGITLPRRLQ